MTRLWDPLWEYMLEDYMIEENSTQRSRHAQRPSNSRFAKMCKVSRSSTRRNVKVARRTKEQEKELARPGGHIHLSYLSLFQSSDDKKGDHGDTRDDEDDDWKEQYSWSLNWFDGRSATKEVTQQACKKKAILRRCDGKSSTGELGHTSFVSDVSNSQEPSSRSLRSVVNEPELDNAMRRRSSLKMSKSGSSRNLKPETCSKSLGENQGRKDQHETLDTQDSFAGFRGVWGVITGNSSVGGDVAQTTISVATTRDPEPKEVNPETAKKKEKGREFSLALRKSLSQSSGLIVSESESQETLKKQRKSYSNEKRKKRAGPGRRNSKREQNPIFSSRSISVKENLNSSRDIDIKDVEVSDTRKEKENKAFNPMMLLFEVAGKIDPWGVESWVDDSKSETVASETTGLNEKTYGYSHSVVPMPARPKTGNTKSLLDQTLHKRKDFDPRYACRPYQSVGPPPAYSTEIRLKVNTLGNTISEEVYKYVQSVPAGKIESDTDNSQIWGVVDAPQTLSVGNFSVSARNSVSDTSVQQSSFSESPKPSDKSEKGGMVSPQTIPGARLQSTTRIDGAVQQCPSDQVKVPVDLHIPNAEADVFTDGDNKVRPESKSRMLWNTVCCNGGNKSGSNCNLASRLRKEDAADVFPATRLIANGKSCSVTGRIADHVNGVMGVPSDHFVGSKGPQSLYAYDYEGNTNMDACYMELNKKARFSVTVRSLGEPPSLSESSGESVVVQIAASTVSETDCLIRRGKWWLHDQPALPTTPGVDMVGKVFHIKKTLEELYGLRPRQTVMSLISWGGNSRYAIIHPNQLVKVPDGLDPAEVTCLPETYLAAFQCLHMGQHGSKRYGDNSLKGKSVLIVGCMSNNMGRAIIELAQHAGVTSIYATCKKKHWQTLISYGVLPLSQNPDDWIQRIEGTIDLVLAPNGNLREDVTPVHFRALFPKQGQLILCGRRFVGNDIPIDEWKKQQLPLACGRNKALVNILNQSHAYDVYEQWLYKLELCKKDLVFLLGLLERGLLKPEVLDRLPLTKVAKAEDLLESKRLPGFLVCEPWMRSKKRAVYL